MVAILLSVVLQDAAVPSLKSWLFQNITNLATIAGAVAVVAALLYTRSQLKLLADQISSDKQARLDARTFDLMKRWNNPAFMHTLVTVLAFMRKNSVDDVVKRAGQDLRFKGSLHLALNMLEELGINWKSERINRKLFRNFFQGIVLQLYDDFHPYIVKKRTEPMAELWREFEDMRNDLFAKTETK